MASQSLSNRFISEQKIMYFSANKFVSQFVCQLSHSCGRHVLFECRIARSLRTVFATNVWPYITCKFFINDIFLVLIRVKIDCHYFWSSGLPLAMSGVPQRRLSRPSVAWSLLNTTVSVCDIKEYKRNDRTFGPKRSLLISFADSLRDSKIYCQKC